MDLSDCSTIESVNENRQLAGHKHDIRMQYAPPANGGTPSLGEEDQYQGRDNGRSSEENHPCQESQHPCQQASFPSQQSFSIPRLARRRPSLRAMPRNWQPPKPRPRLLGESSKSCPLLPYFISFSCFREKHLRQLLQLRFSCWEGTFREKAFVREAGV